MTTLAPERTTPKGLVLAICCLSLLMVSMDSTVVNVALPSIGADLHTTVSTLQWTVDGYTVAIAGFLLLAGSTADRIGRRKVFQVGLATFSVASLACSLAPTIGLLIAARVLQGLGGSMLNPVAMSIITNTFTERRERARAVGAWGAVVGISMAFGPLVGGFLTEHVGWQSIFWINVPIGAAAIALTALFVPESRAARPRHVDPVGQGLVIVVLTSLVYALIEGPSDGWTSPHIVVLILVAVAAVIGVVRYERRRTEPFLDVRFFRSVPFASATLTAVLAFSSYGAFLFVNALYLQQVRGLSPATTGVWMLPIAIATLLASLNSGRMVAHFGTRPSLIVSGVLLGTAGLWLTRLGTGTSHLELSVIYVVFGVGFGTINTPITTTAVSGMPLSQAGVASAIASTSRQTGAAIGVAVAGTLTGAGAAATIGPSFATGTHPLWWVVAVSGFAVAVIGYVSTTPAARRSTDAVRALLVDD